MDAFDHDWDAATENRYAARHDHTREQTEQRVNEIARELRQVENYLRGLGTPPVTDAEWDEWDSAHAEIRRLRDELATLEQAAA